MSSPTVRHEAAIGPRPMADAGLRAAIRETLPEAAHQRCHAHFLRNALDRLPRKADDDCLQELRWLYDRRDLAEAGTDLAAWLAKREARYPRLAAWAEEAIEETLTFHRLPRRHHKHLESANMLERLNEEIKRRTPCRADPLRHRLGRSASTPSLKRGRGVGCENPIEVRQPGARWPSAGKSAEAAAALQRAIPRAAARARTSPPLGMTASRDPSRKQERPLWADQRRQPNPTSSSSPASTMPRR